MQLMKILPGIGIGSIRFGMSPIEVTAAINEPQQYEDWMGGNLNDALLFHGLIFTFDRCDSRGPLPNGKLDRIEIHGREDAELFGQPLDAWTEDSIVRRLQDEGHVPQLAPGSVEVPHQLRLWFRNGSLDEIAITGSPHNQPIPRSGRGSVLSFVRRLWASR